MSESAPSQVSSPSESFPASPVDAGYEPDAKAIVEDRGADYSLDPNGRYSYRYDQGQAENQAWSEGDSDGIPEQPYTLEEQSAQETLSNAGGELADDAGEKATLRIRALNGLDRTQRLATLKTARQWRMEGRVARLDRKLAKARPHSRKHMRLEAARNIANYRLGKIENAQNKVFDRMHSRSAGYKAEVIKVANIERKKGERVAKRKVALENKRRRKIKKRYIKELEVANPNLKDRARKELFSDKSRKEQLYKEILSWKGNGMRKFEEGLFKEIEEKYKKRVEKGKL